MHAHKFFLDVSAVELIKRYYLRVCKTGHNAPKIYWNCLANDKCYVMSSQQIIKNMKYDRDWHIKHGYKLATDKHIIQFIESLR